MVLLKKAIIDRDFIDFLVTKIVNLLLADCCFLSLTGQFPLAGSLGTFRHGQPGPALGSAVAAGHLFKAGQLLAKRQKLVAR